MQLRTYAGFVADFPDECGGDEPAGRELAQFISQGLRQHGFATEHPCEREGFAWEFNTKESSFCVSTIVGWVGDMDTSPPRQWLITNDSNLGILRRVFGGRSERNRHQEWLRNFCEIMHEIMANDDRFFEITWHIGKYLDKPEDVPDGKP